MHLLPVEHCTHLFCWVVVRNKTVAFFVKFEAVHSLLNFIVSDFSDYKEHKLTEENVGFQLLQKAGWTEGSGLGAKGDGITAPINK